MTEISRDELQKIVEGSDAVLVDVLGRDAYENYHLPGAINVPIGGNFDDNIEKAVPDKSKPVVVYCMDEECNASPKALKRMEKLGYSKVYDYTAGKKDWKNAGLPTEKAA